MKKLFVLLLLCGGLMFVNPAYAILVGTTDVGSVDELLDSETITDSADADELNWVNSVLETEFTAADLTKYAMTPETGAPWVPTDTTNVYAIDLVRNAQYFYIKVGANASKGEITHYLYRNLASFEWGVINLQATGVNIKNIGKVSHIGEVGTPVPEANTLLLLGLGLAGLAGARKKFKK